MLTDSFTAGSRTTFNPLISWITLKKSFRSRSLKLSPIGSPVYRPGTQVEELEGPMATEVPAWICCCKAALMAAGWAERLELAGNGVRVGVAHVCRPALKRDNAAV